MGIEWPSELALWTASTTVVHQGVANAVRRGSDRRLSRATRRRACGRIPMNIAAGVSRQTRTRFEEETRSMSGNTSMRLLLAIAVLGIGRVAGATDPRPAPSTETTSAARSLARTGANRTTTDNKVKPMPRPKRPEALQADKPAPKEEQPPVDKVKKEKQSLVQPPGLLCCSRQGCGPYTRPGLGTQPERLEHDDRANPAIARRRRRLSAEDSGRPALSHVRRNGSRRHSLHDDRRLEPRSRARSVAIGSLVRDRKRMCSSSTRRYFSTSTSRSLQIRNSVPSSLKFS